MLHMTLPLIIQNLYLKKGYNGEYIKFFLLPWTKCRWILYSWLNPAHGYMKLTDVTRSVMIECFGVRKLSVLPILISERRSLYVSK